MRRTALVALCTSCAVAVGIALSVERPAVGAAAQDQGYRPLSTVPRVERFGQAALDAQAAFLQRMPNAQISFGDNGAVAEIRGRTGVVLQSGLVGLTDKEPAKELLEKIGPALLAAGTEELRVFRVNHKAPRLKPDSPERTARLVQYIRGREVQHAAVNITLNIQTNEITHVVADFLPDRGLQHEPRFTAAEARAKVEAAMRDSVLEDERRIIFEDSPAHLAYAFEEFGNTGGIGGVLVWVFLGTTKAGEPQEVVINALTGKVVRLQSYVTGAALSGATLVYGRANGTALFELPERPVLYVWRRRHSTGHSLGKPLQHGRNSLWRI